MSKVKSVDSSIKTKGSTKLKVVVSSVPPPEEQFYTLSNEPIIAINGEKIVPIKP